MGATADYQEIPDDSGFDEQSAPLVNKLGATAQDWNRKCPNMNSYQRHPRASIKKGQKEEKGCTQGSNLRAPGPDRAIGETASLRIING